MSTLDEFMRKSEEDLTEEEGRLLELLAVLAEEYEERVHSIFQSKNDTEIGFHSNAR